MATVWLHRQTSVDNDFVERLLRTARRVQPDLTPLALSAALIELGHDMRTRAAGDERVLWEAQRLIDAGGWLNAPKEVLLC